MNETIEQLEQEKADILAKALNLVAKIRNAGPFAPSDLSEEIAAIEAIKPKLEIRKAWIHYNGNQIWVFKSAEEVAKETKFSAGETVPMIEIRPIAEVPTWEEWRCVGSLGRIIRCDGRTDIGSALDGDEADDIVKTHNTEMRRLQDFINQLLAERGEA